MNWPTRLALVFLAFLASPAIAQTLDDLRAQFREGLQDAHFAKSFAGLIQSSDDFTFSGANYDFDNASGTSLQVLGLPYDKVLSPEANVSLRFEGAVGYGSADEYASDVYSGALPGLETSVNTTWTTFSALIGAGPRFRIDDVWSVSAMANVGVANIRNDTDYAGSGAAVTAALADGIAFNWDAWVLSYGGAGIVDYERDLGSDYTACFAARYDLRWTDTLDTDDAAQEFDARTQTISLRTDVTGPTGIDMFGGPLHWRATAGYRRFLEGDLYDANDFLTFGGALELGKGLPIVSRLSVEAMYIVGNDLTGFGFGVGVGF